jgi:hypothetical protein
MWGALSDERAGLSLTTAAGPRQRSYFRVHILLSQIRDIFASYDLQGYGGDIRPRPHTGLLYGSLNCVSSFYNCGRTDERPLPPTVRVLVCLQRNVCQSRGNTLISTSVFVATKRAFSEPLYSNGRFVLLSYSGFQPSWHRIFIFFFLFISFYFLSQFHSRGLLCPI